MVPQHVSSERISEDGVNLDFLLALLLLLPVIEKLLLLLLGVSALFFRGAAPYIPPTLQNRFLQESSLGLADLPNLVLSSGEIFAAGSLPLELLSINACVTCQGASLDKDSSLSHTVLTHSKDHSFLGKINR